MVMAFLGFVFLNGYSWMRAQASHNTAAVAAWQVWRCTLT